MAAKIFFFTKIFRIIFPVYSVSKEEMEKLLQDVTKTKFLCINKSFNDFLKIDILEINGFSYNYLTNFFFI